MSDCPHVIEANINHCLLCGAIIDTVDRSLLESAFRMGEYGIDPREAEPEDSKARHRNE